MEKPKNTDIPNYVKQEDGAVINTNNAELNQYLEAREALKTKRDQQRRFNELEEKVEGLDNKLNLILEKLSNG